MRQTSATQRLCREIAPLFAGGRELTSSDIVWQTRGLLSPGEHERAVKAVARAIGHMNEMGLLKCRKVQGKRIWSAS